MGRIRSLSPFVSLLALGACRMPGLPEGKTADHARRRRAQSVDKNIQLLKDKQPGFRVLGCRRLGRLGSNALPAVPELKRIAQHDRDARVRQAAAECSS